jgi:diguanylate cyclase (GGDEF)-like protein
MLSALVGDLVLLPILIQRVELVTLWDLVRIKMGGDTRINIPLFQGLSRAEVHSIIMAGTLKKVNAGDFLFYKGDQSESMYAVISGGFDVIDYDSTCTLISPEGIQKCIVKVGAGDILGEMGLLRAAPRSATVVATATSELLPINWKVIQRLQWLYPPTAQKFFVNMMRILCDRVERLTTCLANESQMDDLTGLSNKKGFCRCLEQEMHRAKRHQKPLMMAALEIAFLDHHSQEAPVDRNIIMQEVSESLSANIRRCDVVGRIDTNLFVVLIPGGTDDGVRLVIERLQKDIQTLQNHYKSSMGFTAAFTAANLSLKKEKSGEAILEKTLRRLKTEKNRAWTFTSRSVS